MKKRIRLQWLFATICLTIAILSTSCQSESSSEHGLGSIVDREKKREPFWDKYTLDDFVSKEEALTVDYDLNELLAFFEKNDPDEESEGEKLSFSQINLVFPVEIIRSGRFSDGRSSVGRYSIYKVHQGGLFYLFWDNSYTLNWNNDMSAFIHDSTVSISEPSVKFYAYLPADKRNLDFDTSITVGVSTADDVTKIDPYAEFSTLLSYGIVSYSFLDESTVVRIEYDSTGVDNSKILVVKDVSYVNRTDSYSCLCDIFPSDLPDEKP